MNNLAETIAGMGRTPTEIAQFLQNKHVTGQRRVGELCPVANYLRSEGFNEIFVTAEGVAALGCDEIAFGPRSAVAKFVEGFDEGDYPQLVEPE